MQKALPDNLLILAMEFESEIFGQVSNAGFWNCKLECYSQRSGCQR